MASRLDLHEELVNILGSRNVYYQPPESVRMSYPAIKYELKQVNREFADGVPYKANVAYTVTSIDSDPESPVLQKLLELPYSSFERHYVSEGLNHDVYTIYY